MIRVGFIQTAPRFGDGVGNRERLESEIRALDADLIVVPELCHSGYVFSSREEAIDLAEPVPSGPTSELLASLAREKGCIIVAGLCERAGDLLYNSAGIFGPRGHVDTYRKLHLFKDEKLWFESGDTPLRVHDFDGFRLGVLVCYDWRFPEATRALALLGAEVLAHPSNLVLPFCQEVMRARCIENRIFAVTANRVGTDAKPDGRSETFTGQSQVVDPDGTVLVRASTDETAREVVAIDPAEARRKSFNEHNHLFDDRRPEYYEALAIPKTVPGS